MVDEKKPHLGGENRGTRAQAENLILSQGRSHLGDHF
jgi:hypothetical protein